MKAIVARDFGPPENLEYTDWPEPQPGPDEVVIEAEAIGVNFPDGLLVQGLYQLKPDVPFVPGMEMAGKIVAIGGNVKSLKVGDRVAAIGSLGAYAERMAASERSAMKLPDGMPGADACALMCGYGTAHHALKQRANLRPGETLCVLGASGLTGIAAIQVGKAMGARVIGYDNLREDLKKLTGGEGLDVAFDPVGGDMFDALARSMGWGGRLLVIGFASGTIPKLPVNLTLVKGFSVVGVFWGAFTRKQSQVYADNMRELVGWYMQGKVKPVIEGSYRLADAAQVLKRVLGRGATGKLVLEA
jgi:NADPH2:quinone reductase